MTRTTRLFFGTSLTALLIASSLHLAVLSGTDWVWSALVHLTLLGWITGMIMAVNYHTMPVFSGRDWPYPALIGAHWAAFVVGITLATAGLLGRWSGMVSAGLLLQLIAALLFVANSVLLFRQGTPRAHRAPVPPLPDQPDVDRVGTQAAKSAAMCLPLALLLLLAQQREWINGGWLLAAEHLLALGWIMLMIAGVAYHVLPRFSGRAVRGVVWARAQVQCHHAALVLVVLGLGFGSAWLFAFGALLMAAAIALFAWTVWPTLVGIRPQRQLIQIMFKERPR